MKMNLIWILIFNNSNNKKTVTGFNNFYSKQKKIWNVVLTKETQNLKLKFLILKITIIILKIKIKIILITDKIKITIKTIIMNKCNLVINKIKKIIYNNSSNSN